MKTKKVASAAKPRTQPRREERFRAQQERIAMRAYQLYLSRGGVDGEALRDWLEAEREIGGQNETGDSP